MVSKDETEVCSSNGISGGEICGKHEGYTPGKSLGEEVETEVGSCG